jgi:hypothetical protein
MARFEHLNVNKLNVTKLKIGGGSAEQDGYPLTLLEGADITVTADGSTAALSIPANTLVLQVFTETVTDAGETCTADIGDGTTSDGWDAAVDLNTTAGTRASSVLGTDAYAVGKLYSAADTIDADVTLLGGTGTVVFKVQALCVKM